MPLLFVFGVVSIALNRCISAKLANKYCLLANDDALMLTIQVCGSISMSIEKALTIHQGTDRSRIECHHK